LGAIVASLGLGTRARASSGIESPEAGATPIGRGGAWLVRADDPLAAYVNPAALVTQGHGVSGGLQLLLFEHCYDRRTAQGDRPSPGQSLAAPSEPVCADRTPYPNPQLAASLRLHQRFALGLAVLGPHAKGSERWPATIVYADRMGDTEHPSPQRYLMLESDNLLLFPTLSASVAVTRQLSFGAGFVWGVASIDVANMAESVSPWRDPAAPDDFTGDLRSRIRGVDAFVPGLVASVLWSPSERLGLAGWFRWSDAVRTTVDLTTQSSYYTTGGRVNEAALANPSNLTEVEAAGRLTIPLPMEAKLGLRYRHPRASAERPAWATQWEGWVRDPLSTELFDLELDLSWANNSSVEAIELGFEPGIRIKPTTGFVPENADIRHHWRDALGVRLGGDVVVLPSLLALRAGGFFESSSADPTYLTLDFHPSERVGLGAGGTVRLGPVDLSLAYQHTFFGTIDNGGRGDVHAISGDATTGQRSRQAVNGGKATASLDELGLGVAARY
jgi:long-subunit fatty acid transport protein